MLPCRVPFAHNAQILRKRVLSRYLSDKPLKAPVQDNKAFTKTLLLPKTSFPLRVDPEAAEKRFRELTCDGVYRWQWENAKGPLFVLHDGPPYANGDLHMGHALNKVIKDIINRFHVLRGRKVHYVPGWDCHGLPIENKAMKDRGMNPLETPPSVVRKAARETALREITSQKEQFKPLGIMADWDSTERTYRTLDKHYVIRQLRVFQKMVENGLIYRQHRPVHYSPSSRSALAEAELVYKDDHVSHSIYVPFAVDTSGPLANAGLQKLVESGKNMHLLIWTTTPWTLTANMAIAVHNELAYSIVEPLERDDLGFVVVATDRIEALSKVLGPLEIVGQVQGSDLVGTPYRSIFSSSAHTFKVIPAIHVTAESGTGLVHCAPAHGAEDYNALRSLGLLSSHEMLCHVDAKGEFRADVVDVVGEDVASQLVGKSVLDEGNKAMVLLLKDLGKVLSTQRLKHRYPYDWKTDKPIIVTATSQWFANLEKIKEGALSALQDVSFFPSPSRNRLESFIRARSEWCISRQRVWGVPIPALHQINSDNVVLNGQTLEYIIDALERKDLDWWESPVEEFVPPSLLQPGQKASDVWAKGTDTMDVWFDSGSSWSMLSEMGVGHKEVEGRRFDADLCLEGSDQHRGWFQSQLLTAIASRGGKEGSPYGGLITHGMVLDEKGKKMSKSLGNIVSPMTIVKGSSDGKKPAHGADLLRLWAATVDYWRDMSIGPTVIAQAAESMRKIRNSARFCLGNLGDGRVLEADRVPRDKMGLAERYVMHELYSLENTALDGYSTYNFPKVINSLNIFTNLTLSSLYFDITKDCLYANAVNSLERRAVVTVLDRVLDTMTNIMAPVLPYLAEEIRATRFNDGKSVFMTTWQPLSEGWNDPQAALEMSQLLRIRSEVNALLEKARSQKLIKSALETEVDIIVPESLLNHPLIDLLSREEAFLKTLFIVSDASITDEGSLRTKSPEWLFTETLSVPDAEEGIAIRVRPATKEKCPRCWTFTRPESDTMCGRCAEIVV